MTDIATMQPGAVAELPISQEGAKRFLVGLSWDPPQQPGVKIKLADRPDDNAVSKTAYALFAPFEFLRVLVLSFANLVTFGMFTGKLSKQEDKAGRDKGSEAYDLDLCCYVYDSAMQLKAVVETEDDKLFDPSKKIYHTGEDQGGMGGGDDEVVFVETNGLPADYAHLYFVVKSDSKYDLSQFSNARIRIADSKTGNNVVDCPISAPGKFNFVFCKVSRAGEGWRVQHIAQPVDEDFAWATALPQIGA
ncbi:MAG TPA: TerD family protein [Patescibacteria group bacterium]|nr:TerD family protein [Patescibacteria group bacterium]